MPFFTFTYPGDIPRVITPVPIQGNKLSLLAEKGTTLPKLMETANPILLARRLPLVRGMILAKVIIAMAMVIVTWEMSVTLEMMVGYDHRVINPIHPDMMAIMSLARAPSQWSGWSSPRGPSSSWGAAAQGG